MFDKITRMCDDSELGERYVMHLRLVSCIVLLPSEGEVTPVHVASPLCATR